ncbi:condensin subunit ScpB [Jatrophihabitans endophyticus]|uniref:Condensin subunit ScpB n=1 Tax=Jatrophihabitans endophyticus TaxID=1206085 RepID=A0A1M5MR15_9ACTN|nr:SMC-Scp complex subunit ScpB [Jatrophihabitans endophyticus]SHG79512.1 condensin subunit ScpB [Jatrophihabitans endophyticus]
MTDPHPSTAADPAAAGDREERPLGDPLDAISVAAEADVVAAEIEVPVDGPVGVAVGAAAEDTGTDGGRLPGVLAARLAEPGELRAAVEAVLFVVEAPVSVASLAATLEQTTDAVQGVLAELRAGYDERNAGMELRDVAGGVRLFTRAEHADVVEHFLRDGQRSRLSQAALETLAVIAYRQPVTRARVSAIRGVNVDGVVRTLLARGLVVEVGTDPETGGGLFRTTELFLERMGLRSLAELPSLAPLLPDLAALDGIDGIDGIDVSGGLDGADGIAGPGLDAVTDSDTDTDSDGDDDG